MSLSYTQYRAKYPVLSSFSDASPSLKRTGLPSRLPREKDPSLIKASGYLGGSAYAGKVAADSGLTRLLGARLERHSTSKEAAKQIIGGGGYLDASRGVRKSMALLEDPPDDPFLKNLYADRLNKSQGKNFISGVHPDKKTVQLVNGQTMPFPRSPLRDVLFRRLQALTYRSQSEVDFRKYASLTGRQEQTVKNLPGAMIGTKGKTLFVPVTDSEVLNKFQPDVDDPFALMTSDKVKVYSNRYKALLGHLKKNKLSQVAANPGRLAVGAAVLGGAGTLAYKLGQKGYAEVKAYKRNGKLVKGHKRKLD